MDAASGCVFQVHFFTGFCRGSHTCGTLAGLYLIGSELHMLEIGLYGTYFGQARWTFLLDLSNKGPIPITLSSFHVRKS